MKKNKSKVTHYENKTNKTNLNNNLYDNEFANEYNFEDRQLQLQVKQNRQSQQNKTKSTTNKDKTA